MSLLLPLLLPLLQEGPPSPPLPEGMVLIEGECVSHPDGAPVPGVHLTMRDPTQGCKSPETQTTATDADGKFRFAPFPKGRRWIVTRSPTDGQTKRSLYPPTDHDLDPAQPGPLHLRIVLGEFGSVRGRVLDAETGTPVRAAQVSIRTEGSPVPVDPATGTFTLPRVVLRSRGQQVVADAPGYAQTWGVLRMGEKSIEGMSLH
ncbi:MAG TPA: carboxypeptidase-like regulatory domain-containing protein, partial [Planctomycetota bacterium]|nr:carboxypeptidase-like regulatory domain-containing protein [Planctomycetota bacterium]